MDTSAFLRRIGVDGHGRIRVSKDFPSCTPRSSTQVPYETGAVPVRRRRTDRPGDGRGADHRPRGRRLLLPAQRRFRPPADRAGLRGHQASRRCPDREPAAGGGRQSHGPDRASRVGRVAGRLASGWPTACSPRCRCRTVPRPSSTVRVVPAEVGPRRRLAGGVPRPAQQPDRDGLRVRAATLADFEAQHKHLSESPDSPLSCSLRVPAPRGQYGGYPFCRLHPDVCGPDRQPAHRAARPSTSTYWPTCSTSRSRTCPARIGTRSGAAFGRSTRTSSPARSKLLLDSPAYCRADVREMSGRALLALRQVIPESDLFA